MEYPDYFSKRLKPPTGYYITINSEFFKEVIPKLSAGEIADFIFLACNCNFSYCVSHSGSSIPMQSSKIKSAICDSRLVKLNHFTKEGLISFGKGERCYISNKYVFLGGNKDENKREFGDGVRIYKEYYNQFYKNCNISERKTLGTIYRLVPYLNRKWNVVTEPDNTPLCDLLAIQPCRRERVVELIGYKAGNTSLYIKKLTDLAISADGNSYRAVIHGIRNKGLPGGFYVNPYLAYYGYNDIEPPLNISVKTSSGERIGYLREIETDTVSLLTEQK